MICIDSEMRGKSVAFARQRQGAAENQQGESFAVKGAPSTVPASYLNCRVGPDGARRSTSGRHYFVASAAVMASVASVESGVILESKRLRIFPSLPMRNLVKFHLILPGNGEASPASAT